MNIVKNISAELNTQESNIFGIFRIHKYPQLDPLSPSNLSAYPATLRRTNSRHGNNMDGCQVQQSLAMCTFMLCMYIGHVHLALVDELMNVVS